MKAAPYKLTKAVVLSLTVLLFAALQVVMLPTSAEARCNGDAQVISTLVIGTYGVAAVEYPAPGACDRNNIYRGFVKSQWCGWQAEVWVQNNGKWQLVALANCYEPTYYEYSDNNSYSYIHLCIDQGPKNTRCGWGDRWQPFFTHSIYGENKGY